MANDEDSDESSAEVEGVEEVGIEGDREEGYHSESVGEDKAEPSNEQEPMIDRDALSEAVEENHDDKEEEPTNEQELEGDEDQIERNTEEDNCEASSVSAKSDSDSRNDGSDEDGMERDINFEIEASSETVEDSQKEEPINVDDEDGIIGDSEDELPNFAQTMIAIRKRALGNIQNAQGRQKKYYDAKHCKDKEMYKVGTLVLLKNSKKLSRKGSKLEPNWTGPYRINEVLKKGTFRLCSANNTSNVLSSTYNMARLKLYFLSEHSDSKQNSFAAPTVGHNSQQHAPVQQEDMAQPSVCKYPYNNYLHL